MIERLRRALEHIDELSPAMQEEIAAQIEEMTEPLEDVAVPVRTVADHTLPRSVRDALAMVGASRTDLQDDDEFEALDRIRHESAPRS
jgi:hypothetical protein